jgi:hypothetical protein
MRVPRMRSALPLALCFLMLFCNARVLLSQSTTTTVTISSVVETGGIDRPGINLGGLANYGSQQLLKSLNYVSGGYFPGTYAGATYPCSGGGSNTTTAWYNSITNPSGFPANFWAGASFVAINTATGTSYGSGVVSASTSNTGTTGITFTLSPALTAACNPSQNDVLIVRQTAETNLFAPNQLLNVCSSASWDTSDTSPSSSNTQRSLQMPTGCGLTFYLDATVSNRTNTNGQGGSTQVNFININGSYTATFKAKCRVAGCSVNFSLGRLGGTTYVANTIVSPGFSTTPGAGWTTYDYPFTASDTGIQAQTVGYSFSCTGSCLLQDADVVEGSTLPGNTTAFRDAVVYELQKIHPGSIRYMDASQWCSDVADEIASTGNRRWCGASSWAPGVGQAMGYNDVLELANFLDTDVLISVGQLNQPSDWAMLVSWLSSSGWISKFAASGHTIYLEDGNEAWNSGVGSTLYYGNGSAYGYTLGPNMAAAKSATGYDPHVIKLVGNSWVAANQGYGPFGWVHNVLTVAQTTPNGLPDFMDDAPYTLNYMSNFDTYGSNVATTGAPFLDEWAEDANIDSVTTPLSNSQSMYLNQQYAKANFGVGTLVYEVNQSTLSGAAATQLQLNQIGASVGNALAIAEHVLLMQRDSQLTGPIHAFTLAEPYTGYTCTGNGCSSGAVMPLWGTTLFMATGPGQTPGSANSDRPLAIALGVINNAIGSNGNLMSVTQSGTPTFNYPGGQAGSIQPNAAVPYVNCFAYSNGQGSWTTICFNNNLTTAESVTLTGPGAPTGPVSETIFPERGNFITDQNEDTFLGAGSSAPMVAVPTASSASGATYSIPPASFIALTYTTGGTSTLVPPTFSPGSGTYSATQTVTISFPSGSTGCVGINTTPLAPTPGTCGAGGTTYTGPITVSSSETVNAIATQAGSSNSAVATAVYTINLPNATPIINWPTPAAISTTTPLSSTQLDGTATFQGAAVPGTYFYTVPPGTADAHGQVLTAGTHTLQVVFTPTDTTDFISVTATVQIVVGATGSTGISGSPVFSSSDCCFFSQATPYIVTVPGSTAAPTGTVSVTFKGQTLGTGTLTPGPGASSSVTLLLDSTYFVPGNNTVTLNYFGDMNNVPSSNSATIPLRNPAIGVDPANVGGGASTIYIPYTYVVPGSMAFNFNPAGGAVSDFSNTGATTCTTGIQPAGTVCMLAVAFNPSLPGIRKGVVELDFTPTTGPAEPILYLFLSGLGSAAQIALGDATQQVLNSTLLAPQSVTFNPADRFDSTLYVANSYAGQIVTLASSGGSLTPWNAANTGNLAYPIDIVFDAFGNLIVADSKAAKVFSLNPALAETTISTGTITVGAPGAAKVDLAGDVFIADDSNTPKVVMVPGETYDTTYKPSVLLDSTTLSYPQALAVDNSGANLYVGDGNTNQILKVGLNGTGTSQLPIAPCAATVTPCAFNAPTGIAFDPNGDMYITDGTPRLLMVPANHSSGGQTTLMPMTGLVNPTNVSVDGSGNIYVTDYVGTLTKLSVNTGAMKVAASDPQTTTVTNTGNLDLTIASLTFTNGAGSAFSETDTCTSAPIPPGGSCTITVSYSNPAGTATDTLNISSNAFSLSGVTIQVSTNQGIQVSTNHSKSRVRCEHGACFSPGMPVARLRERNQTAK